MRTACKVLEAMAGLKVMPGGLSQALDRVAGRVKPHYDSLFEQLRNAPVVFADETSWWVGGPGWWLHAQTNPETTIYQVRPTAARRRSAKPWVRASKEPGPGERLPGYLRPLALPHANHRPGPRPADTPEPSARSHPACRAVACLRLSADQQR